MLQQPTRLQLLVRQNKGSTEYQYYATELAHMLGTDIHSMDILDLPETDRLLTAHRIQSVRSNKEADFAFKKVWNYKPMDPWSRFCRCLAEKLCGETAILFIGPYEFCGAVKVSVDLALNEAPSLLEFDKDTVSLQSVTTESGLYLDLFEERSEWFVELVAWGQWKTWASQVNSNEHR